MSEKTTQNVTVGRKVSFVGGPLAGDVRTIPESVGEILKAQNDGDYFYRMAVVNDEQKELTVKNWGMENTKEGDLMALRIKHIEPDENGETVYYLKLEKLN